jgi:hypothetical protein
LLSGELLIFKCLKMFHVDSQDEKSCRMWKNCPPPSRKQVDDGDSEDENRNLVILLIMLIILLMLPKLSYLIILLILSRNRGFLVAVFCHSWYLV